MTKSPLTIVLASPRGFCAGVDRAILIVEAAIEKYGTPVYVRHEIVHNRFVVDTLKAKGAVFVDELTEVPDGVPVVFSAHGVPKSVPQAADSRGLDYLDATCPLVTKVHREAELHHEMGRQIIMIGHKGHPEVIGTMGQVPAGAVLLVENVDDAETVSPAAADKLAYITQTTLSVDDTIAIVEVLRRRFPDIVGPRKDDICYATTNRQIAVKTIAPHCDAVMVIGSPQSSNSKRLVEVAARSGCAHSILVERAADLDWNTLAAISRLGITAGASAPEVLVEEVIAAARARFAVTIEEIKVTDETVAFKLPPQLL
ncbi:4-hydroxy-3-methylbut-2-enyl diphosphate reductase [Magnetospirillum sulfuroxidans]|uniref:4-hydroxy-3-methylbut-2-enyl diphosphate reductase n=1 Tax=Magnetospirillum sulfuroxidans TaxID=611300 RepID=A0ABS5IH53_9PROT|nr:4-hydroxy-3-methylbut-2-enyl diphosphate reductase [Magnetospirillum sulfuroxidans]MBR9973023.1 4-hydroxy-3-methylbut-2-enyl diphosphate reductase [Magnetospirillum sulfuroxidans]